MASLANSTNSLDDAYEACRLETAEWAKTFYLGTLLLPLEKRRAIWAIYVWCRRTDELMDSAEAQMRSIAELSERLDRWEQKTRAVFDGHVEDQKVDRVLAKVKELTLSLKVLGSYPSAAE